jgi:hypothetical protein
VGDIQVSVIIPVYNAADFLDECLSSITEQTLGFDRIEIVAVDDGSTDGSGELLDRWAAGHDGIRVVHQENSGAPGGPRNRGIGLARGDFLFFADPDDYLGRDALRRMVEVAERNGSDVVLGRMRGVGRGVPTEPFARNVERGDVWSTGAVWTLTPQKLIRRSLVTEHGLRFAEGVRLAEEQPFLVPAYLRARAISVVGDYDCYYLVDREGFAHLTKQQPPAESFYSAVRASCAAIHALTEPGERRVELLRRHARVEVLNKFGPRFHTWKSKERQESYARLAGELLREYVPAAAVSGFGALDQLRDRLLREGGRVSELISLSRHDGLAWAELEPGPDAVRPLDGGRRIAVRVRSPHYLRGGAGAVRHGMVLRHPDGHEFLVPATATVTDAVPGDGTGAGAGGPLTREVTVDLSDLHHYAVHPGRWTLLLRVTGEDDQGREHHHDLPLHRPARTARRPVRWNVHRGRPTLVRLAGRGKELALIAVGRRAAVRALRRRLLPGRRR